MKKIGAITLLITLLICSAFSLASCNDKSDIPDGMQLVYGGKSAGYYFYAPEEWTVSNVGQIKSAYISRVNTTSVSFAEIDPSVKATDENTENYFFTSYFKDSLSEFPDSVNVTLEGETATFGKAGEEADKALKYAFNYDYSNHKFGFMQILMKKGDRYFIFTYSALLEEKSEGKTYYDYYFEEKVLGIIDSFRFTEKTEEETNKEYKKDADGFSLISSAKLCGFDFYVPDSFIHDYSSAIVSATATDGSNVNMTEATMTGNGMTVNAYWQYRKQELLAIVESITEIAVDTPVSIGNSDAAFAYEYTFVYNGETYRVYQIYAIEGPMLFQDGYVFTYTAKEANYNLHIDEVKSIIEKVKFR